MFNGLSLSEVERRARRVGVGPWRAGDELVRSVSGFLADAESLADVLQADDHAVRVELGLTHHLLATKLADLVRHVETLEITTRQENRVDRLGGDEEVEEIREGGGAYRATFAVDYRPPFYSGSPDNAGAQRCLPVPQRLLVEKRKYHFPQYSLFYNFEQASSENTSWNETYIISNANMDLSPLQVGGNADHGVIDYIRRYGFYEGGGAHNVYRVDPFVLYSMLTGVMRPEALEREIAIQTRILKSLNALLASACDNSPGEPNNSGRLLLPNLAGLDEPERIHQERRRVLDKLHRLQQQQHPQRENTA